MKRKLSKEGLDLIKSFEGLSLKAYKCLPTEKYYTIGYGHYGSDVKFGQVITTKEAEDLLLKDIAKFEANVNSYMSKYNFTQNQFDALVSFAYNIGSINQLTAFGTRSIKTISDKIPLYNKSGGKVVSGLTKRRAKEKALFDKTNNANNVPKDLREVALEVIQGDWGNGTTRKQKLTEAGYDYKEVQKIVNEMLKV